MCRGTTQAALERAKRKQRVAKLAVLPLVGDVENAFKLCLLHQDFLWTCE